MLASCGHETANPPCRETPLRTSTCGPPLDDQPLDHVEAVQFLTVRGHLGQIPTGPGSRAADVDLPVQDTAATEDPADGSHRRQPPDLAGREDLMDDLGAMEPQVAGSL